MAVNLSKGQKISLDKGMTLALVGLGWDTNRYSGGAEFDLDASAFLLGANGKVRKDEDFIFYGNLKSADGSVTHTGDNRTGEGEGDDEVLYIDFTKVPADVERIRHHRNHLRGAGARTELRSGVERLCASGAPFQRER